MDAMDKSHINRDFTARARQCAYAIGVTFGLALFALAAAICAASAVRSNASLQSRPTTPAIYPEFTTAPRAPYLQVVSDRLFAGPFHNFGTWFRGVASWYGPLFNGHRTANGEVYNMYAMTAATSEFHPRLPLGTKVRVVNTRNGRSVVVRITDRGPLPHGRIIDLSYGAARKLAMVRPGIAMVRIQVLRWGRNLYHAPARG